jgi:hypothetical protein
MTKSGSFVSNPGLAHITRKIMSRFKIAVSNNVLVNVAGTTTDENGVAKAFSFGLICKRLKDSELRAAQNELKLIDVPQFLEPLVTGWRDQTLVLDEDGTPAAFCPEAFAELFSLAGMHQLCFNAYVEAAGATGKI